MRRQTRPEFSREMCSDVPGGLRFSPLAGVVPIVVAEPTGGVVVAVRTCTRRSVYHRGLPGPPAAADALIPRMRRIECIGENMRCPQISSPEAIGGRDREAEIGIEAEIGGRDT